MSNGEKTGQIDVEAHLVDGAAPYDELMNESECGLDGLASPSFAPEDLYAELAFVCAEPGMGKTYLASALMRKAMREGRTTFHHSFDGISSELASKRLIRCCRNLAQRTQPEKPLLVVIDGVTPPDEFEAVGEGRALDKLVGSGAQVLVCIRPEAEQIIENSGNSICMRAADLLFRQYGEDNGAYELTGGIPTLVAAYRLDCRSGAYFDSVGPRYMTALEALVRKTLRDGLTDEERKLRLAMLLLGNGTFDELELVAGRCDEEELQLMSHDVPLLGIDAPRRMFSCHGLNRDELVGSCAVPLQACAALYPELIVRACGVLASRGDVRRSAMVSKLCASEHDLALVCIAWGVLYVNVGEASMVSEAIHAARELGMPSDIRLLLSESAALSAIGSAHQVDDAWKMLGQMGLSTTLEARLNQQVALLGACRDILRYPRHSSCMLSTDAHDLSGLAGLDHLRIVRLLTAGHFHEAYACIANEMLVREPETLFESLVCDDLRLAVSLAGGIPDAKERYLFDKAEEFFERTDMRKLQSYHAALVCMPDILMSGGSDTRCLEDAVAAADRAGDTFFQALCLAVCSIADIRVHALSRAHVRARRASEMARALGEEYLASSAELVDALVLELLGESGAMGSFARMTVRPEELSLLGGALAQGLGEDVYERGAFEVPTGTPCPKDSLWFLNLLERDGGELWDALINVVPASWGELLRAMRIQKASVPEYVPASPAPGKVRMFRTERISLLERGSQSELLPPSDGAGLLRVSILGSFTVESDGSQMSDTLFERRRSRDLLMLLAATPGHKLRRYQAIDILWPGEDYYRGARRLYEATGEARKRLNECYSGLNPLPSDRMQGTVGFDTSVVSFDIDDFERVARRVLVTDGDDFTVLDHARLMERLYSTGPDDRLIALGDGVADRIEAIKTLYVDASVAAGEAALRLGKAKLAVRYGMDAHRKGDLREDAMILLARALKAAGRGFEVAGIFRQYSRHVIEATGVPPSRSLRRSVELALGADAISA